MTAIHRSNRGASGSHQVTVDTLTVLRSFGPRLAKRVARRADDSAIVIDGYEDARHFRASTVAVAGVAAIGGWLARQEGNPRLAVIRAQLRPGVDPAKVRRTLHKQVDPATGALIQPCFEVVPRRWAAIDLDDIALPPGFNLRRGLVGHLVGQLPPQFAGADLALQLTGSAGFTPGIRARLWFWLSRPTSSATLLRWFDGLPVDPSTFRAMQLTYTARPVLVGVADPFPQRIHLLPGSKRAVEVPDLPEPPQPAATSVVPPREAGRYVQAAVGRAAATIAAAGTGGRHARLNQEAFALARLVRAGQLGEASLLASLAAARAAGLIDPEPELRRFIMTGIEAGLRRAGAGHG